MDDKINKGFIKGDRYIKYIDPSMAVLWKTRELSLRPEIISNLMLSKVKEMVFINYNTYIGWVFKVDKIIDNMILKKVGQEEQYYFGIDLREDYKEIKDELNIENEGKENE